MLFNRKKREKENHDRKMEELKFITGMVEGLAKAMPKMVTPDKEDEGQAILMGIIGSLAITLKIKPKNLAKVIADRPSLTEFIEDLGKEVAILEIKAGK